MHEEISAALAQFKAKSTSDSVFEEAVFGLMNHIMRDLTMRYLPGYIAQLRSEGKHQQHVEELEKLAAVAATTDNAAKEAA